LPGADHGVDHDLLGIGVAAQDVEGDALNQAPVLIEQQLDRVRVPRSQVIDQPLVQITPSCAVTDKTLARTESGRVASPGNVMARCVPDCRGPQLQQSGEGSRMPGRHQE